MLYTWVCWLRCDSTHVLSRCYMNVTFVSPRWSPRVFHNIVLFRRICQVVPYQQHHVIQFCSDMLTMWIVVDAFFVEIEIFVCCIKIHSNRFFLQGSLQRRLTSTRFNFSVSSNGGSRLSVVYTFGVVVCVIWICSFSLKTSAVVDNILECSLCSTSSCIVPLQKKKSLEKKKKERKTELLSRTLQFPFPKASPQSRICISDNLIKGGPCSRNQALSMDATDANA